MPTNSKTQSVAEQAQAQLAEAKTLTIKEVVVMSGLSENYVRKAIMSGSLVATKEQIPGRKTERNIIKREDYDAWRASTAAHTRREDGRNKYVVYLTPEEEVKLMALVKELEFGKTLQRANIKSEPVAEEA
jgi:hypothetical protein